MGNIQDNKASNQISWRKYQKKDMIKSNNNEKRPASATPSPRQPQQIIPLDGRSKADVPDLMENSSLEIRFLILFPFCQ